jgi:Amt family ammonium transporter
VFALSLVIWKIIDAIVGVRVSAEEEIEGLDIGEHGSVAYPDFVTVTAKSSTIIGGSVGALGEARVAVAARELSKGSV